MNSKAFFITGTDTGVGKTWVAAALLSAAKKAGLSTSAVKPVAAGCVTTAQGLRNEDALILQEAMTLDLPYEQVNPVALPAAVAPHIAAQDHGCALNVKHLKTACDLVLAGKSDFCLIEGAGGWQVPLNADEDLSDLARVLDLPVILVVGMRLGCLNHTLLTVRAIQQDGLTLAGWVGNDIDANMAVRDENLQTLNERIPAPCLGHIPFLDQQNWAQAADYLDLRPLLTP